MSLYQDASHSIELLSDSFEAPFNAVGSLAEVEGLVPGITGQRRVKR